MLEFPPYGALSDFRYILKKAILPTNLPTLGVEHLLRPGSSIQALRFGFLCFLWKSVPYRLKTPDRPTRQAQEECMVPRRFMGRTFAVPRTLI